MPVSDAPPGSRRESARGMRTRSSSGAQKNPDQVPQRPLRCGAARPPVAVASQLKSDFGVCLTLPACPPPSSRAGTARPAGSSRAPRRPCLRAPPATPHAGPHRPSLSEPPAGSPRTPQPGGRHGAPPRRGTAPRPGPPPAGRARRCPAPARPPACGSAPRPARPPAAPAGRRAPSASWRRSCCRWWAAAGGPHGWRPAAASGARPPAPGARGGRPRGDAPRFWPASTRPPPHRRPRGATHPPPRPPRRRRASRAPPPRRVGSR
mmetsp:Transcript_104053/g.320975  ORF Transcript_104053/g.320975 Transcript_104053/m.320975 type:complete len:264 (-) Transcript_104053:679-1470(-)